MSKIKQYINIIRTQQNIKIDYQILENQNLHKTEHSVFLMENNTLPQDSIFKIKSLENSVKQSYITAICEDKSQKIISKNESIKQNQTTITYDTTHNIVLDNKQIENTKLFYNQGDIDYLISPFTILQTNIQNDLKNNSLNILILNDTFYTLTLDNDNRTVDSSIKSLTPYKDIKDSNFYNDEIVEQKLYDEIYLLELQDNISNILKDFYSKTNNSDFIENINIFYTIKQLNDEQLKSLQENLMIEIGYNSLNIDEILYKITQKENVDKYSFTQKRANSSKFSMIYWIIIAIFTTIIAFGSFYLMKKEVTNKDEGKLNIEKKIEQKKEEMIKIEEISLPDHNITNHLITTLIKNIFESIDDHSVLKEIQIQKDESTIIYDFKAINPFETSLKPKLLQYYEKSENILTTENKGIFTSIISNTNLLNKIIVPTKKYSPTANDRFMGKTDEELFIKSLCNETALIKFIATTQDKFQTSKYEIHSIFKSPIEFFELVEILNKQNYSIVLEHPIEFAQTIKGLEIHFSLLINQNKPLQSTPTN